MQKIKFNFNKISKSRAILFGISTLLIAFFHSQTLYIEKLFKSTFIQEVIIFIRNNSFIGVEIFLLLSGLGLYYSFSKDKNLKTFYIKRLSKIVPAYLIIAIIRTALNGGFGLKKFLYQTLLISFFKDGDTKFWFFGLIIILYLIYPILHKIIEKHKLKSTIILTILLMIFNIILLLFLPEVYSKIEIATTRIPIFIIGIYLGYLSKKEYNISKKWLNILFIISLIIYILLYKGLFNEYEIIVRFLGIPLSISITLILSELFNNIDCFSRNIFSFIGYYSLEMYLIYEYMVKHSYNIFKYRDNYNITYYIPIFFVSLCLSILLKKICNIIIKELNNIKNEKSSDGYSIISIIIIIMLVIIFADNVIKNYENINENINSEKISLITPTNDNQAYHPKIIAFEEKWNGYKYWIAFTPYPKADETKENPVINASNDKIKWEEPSDIINPIDLPNPSDKKHYNSDTHLLYNENLNQLELFWRYVNDEENTVTIYMSTSKDGRNWSEKQIFLHSNDRKNNDWVSPAIILDNNTYKVWYVTKREIYYIEKKNGKITEPKLIKLNYNGYYKTWHIDIIFNYEKQIYEMVTVAYEDINNRKNMNLFYGWSNDNEKWSKAIKILSPSNKNDTWDSQGLYRGSLLYENGTYYLFYSGHDEEMNVGVGLVCGEHLKKLKSCS